MKFEASIEPHKLHDALEALSAVVDEAKFTISEKGITSHMRDPGNVLEVLLKIKKEAFQSWDYEGAPQEIALVGLIELVDKLELLLKIIAEEKTQEFYKLSDKKKKANHYTTNSLALAIEGATNTLLLSRGDFTYRKYLTDPAGIRATPEISITLPIEVRVEAEKLVNALRLVEQESDYPFFDIKEGELIISSGITKEDGDPTTKYKIQPLNVVSAEVHSMYSMDHLSDLKKQITKANVVALYMAKDFPIRMEYSLYSGDIEIEYMLAPRVET